MTATKTAGRRRIGAAPPPPPTGEVRHQSGTTPVWTKRRKTSWITLGLMLTAGASLSGVLLLNAAGSRVNVLVASHDLAAGQAVKASDLRSVSIVPDEGLKVIPASKAAEFVGRVPIAGLSAGTLLNADLFSGASALEAGETIVSASFAAGDVPGGSVHAGDRVALVQVTGANATAAETSRVLAVGSVHSSEVSRSGDVAISLRVPLDRGAAIANAAGQKRLHLLLVPQGTSTDQFPPPDGTTGTGRG